jgi:hypothetical protein
MPPPALLADHVPGNPRVSLSPNAGTQSEGLFAMSYASYRNIVPVAVLAPDNKELSWLRACL